MLNLKFKLLSVPLPLQCHWQWLDWLCQWQLMSGPAGPPPGVPLAVPQCQCQPECTAPSPPGQWRRIFCFPYASSLSLSIAGGGG